MNRTRHFLWLSVLALFLVVKTCRAQDNPNRLLTILFTNDFESAFDPTEAYWRDDIEHIGGIAQLASLVDSIREQRPGVFLFDAGDIFTGTLSKLTLGELPFELMITMRYDAMTIGNHEFEYGWEEFGRQKSRVSFPVLGANLFYKGTNIPYAQPHTVIERDGFRLGVIGIMGQDAATALIPSHIAGLDVRSPEDAVRESVQLLKGAVDLIILLTHQGKTAPMQTNDEEPSVKRDIRADIDLAGAVPGIDVLLGGHADAGTEKPVIHPQTGTIIMQTYGQGFYLGYLELTLNATGRILSQRGRLIPVESDRLQPHPIVANKLNRYKARFPEIFEVIGSTTQRINRSYNEESDLGNLFADILRSEMDADIGLISPGAIRKDLPAGEIRRVELLDAFPFTDQVFLVEMNGSTLLEILEQSLTLERGLLQVSGLKVHYDVNRPLGQRVRRALVGGREVHPDDRLKVATVEILAKGGDRFGPFRQARVIDTRGPTFAEMLEEYFRNNSPVRIPSRGRQEPVDHGH